MDNTVRAISYLRCSTEHQLSESSVGIETQAERIREYCHYKNFTILKEIQDLAVSGSVNKNRKGFRELLELVESESIDVVVIYSLERLSRDMLTLLSIERLFDEHNVKLYTVEGEVNTCNFESWLAFAMKSMWSEVERRQVKYRVQKSMDTLKRLNRVAGTIPYGYRRTGNHLVPIPQEQQVIEIANEMYEEGLGVTEIARRLSSSGYKTRKGKNWSSTQVSRLIKNYQKSFSVKRSDTSEIIKNFILCLS